jgi:hypothetical protein
MEGTKYKGKGQLYHDALTLATCKKTKAYMKKTPLTSPLTSILVAASQRPTRRNKI